MNLTDQLDARSCVLLRLGERRFALAAEQIAELVAPSRVFRFAHRTKEIDGVLIRRGRVVPVCDFAERLTGKKLTYRRFYLVATQRRGESLDWVAVPVSGECELITADLTPAGASDSPHVAAWLSHDGEVIEVLKLAELMPRPAGPSLTPEGEVPEAHA
jgi:chemotaxis signal transduction protein